MRSFLEVIHGAAASALQGAVRPGVLQLVEIRPDVEGTLSFQFDIGDVERMTAQALRSAGSGANCYIETRTVSDTARARGRAADTRGVFAFVVDDDADKGKGARRAITASLVVESSPGNTHQWLFLDRALTPEQAKPLGAAIRAKVGGDSGTGTITQPFRIAGTPNFPGKAKVARGRVPTPTRILEHSGKAWSADELRAAFPAEEKPQATQAGPRPSDASGKTSRRAEEILAQTDNLKRGAVFHSAARAAFKDGLTLTDFVELAERFPDGCAGKFLRPYNRIRKEASRSWGKHEAEAEEIRQAAAKPYYPDAAKPVEEAREGVEAAVVRFLEAATVHRLAGTEKDEPPVHALAVSTGVGKTRITARALARHLLDRRGTLDAPRTTLYAVPTHRLGDEIVELFAEHGITAQVFRGRQAPDPDRPGQTMCDDLEAVELALSFGATVATSCCKAKLVDGTEALCPHFLSCSYQRQKAATPDVWIAAHQVIWQAQGALGEVELVVIDEGFWQSGIRIPKRGLTLDEIEAHLPLGTAREDTLLNDVESYRARLGQALRRQGELGGVHRQILVEGGLTVEGCTLAIAAEWRLKEKVPLWPGMPKAARQQAAKAAAGARHVRGFVALWEAARGLLYDEAIETSGRLYLEERDDGEGRVRVAKARSIKAVAKQWRVPTLILDATLPSPEILQPFFPQVEAAAAVEAAMPHVRVRQVLDAPVAAGKLALDEEGGARRNLKAIHREILRRFIELGRAPLLVVAQKATAEWLRGSRLPDSIAVEHFNNLAGLDRYRDVRGLMVIGRTLPSPSAVEALAGALTGRQPALVEGWYGKAVRGLRTRSGSPAGVECDVHPDPVADACRWQVCEGELIQAIGRARGVNRTAATPLDIDILANVALPMTVDEVVTWEAPSEEVEMWIDGVVLESGADMAAVWPEIWPTADAARQWLKRHGAHTVTDPYREQSYKGICHAVEFRYQRPGARQKWRSGRYDPAVVPDIRVWLESRLGELGGFQLQETAAPPAAGSQAAAQPHWTADRPDTNPANTDFSLEAAE
ncbi:hypothetical protein [Methylobacterium sp. A54F]